MKRLAGKLAGFVLKSVFLIISGSVLLVLLFKFIDPPLTPLMVLRYMENGEGIHKDWRDYDEISDYMKLAVIASEDQLFPVHSGFDIDSIKDALEEKTQGERLRGASTISQQTAKNVFLWPSRSWARKAAEAYFTFLIETTWSKKRILEVYLNIMETGRGIYGAGEAAETYFGKPAGRLTKGEAALIAAALPSPGRMSPARPSGYVRERQRWIMGQMDNLGTGYLKKIE